MPRLQGYRERLWWKYFDTCDLAADPARTASCYLFGNKNVGDYLKTNLQIGGQLSGDQTFLILSLYAVCPLDDRISKCIVNFFIGNRVLLPPITLRDWLMGIRPLRPMVIPVRQNFHAQIDRYDVEFDPPFETQLHIEGLQTRDVA